MHMSRAGLERLTKPWEEFVPYPYDDKVAPRIVGGRRHYVEWTGGAVRGTITIGYGHTDAAGAPLVEPGMRLTEAEAETILLRDMAPCERRVSAALQVAVTQHQYDTLCDIAFNCPSAIAHVCRLVNAGKWPAAEHVMLQYVNSKGERMRGLVNRRNAEIAWANTPDDADASLPTAAGSGSAEIYAPKAERAPPPKPLWQSKSATGAGAVGAGGILAALRSLNDAAAPVEEARQHLQDLGLLDQLAAFAHAPYAGVAIGIGMTAIAAFLFFDRRYKLVNDHV